MSHRPIQFGDSPSAGGDDAGAAAWGEVAEADRRARPVSLDLQKDTALTVVWDDGRTSVYPVKYLRRMSPSAEARQLREEMARNPLTVLSSSGGAGSAGSEGAAFAATGAELVGRYAVRIEFSDGHRTGIYSWPYLRQIDPARANRSPDVGNSTTQATDEKNAPGKAEDETGTSSASHEGIDPDAWVKP